MKRSSPVPAFCSSRPRFSAQHEGPPKSPPATETATIGGKAITIIYSSPGVKGRAGPFSPRTATSARIRIIPSGAQEPIPPLRLKTDADLNIAGLAVPAGTYTLFVDISRPRQLESDCEQADRRMGH